MASDSFVSMSYIHENKKISFVYQALEEQKRSPLQLQQKKKVPLDNASPCSYKGITDPKFKVELLSK